MDIRKTFREEKFKKSQLFQQHPQLSAVNAKAKADLLKQCHKSISVSDLSDGKPLKGAVSAQKVLLGSTPSEPHLRSHYVLHLSEGKRRMKSSLDSGIYVTKTMLCTHNSQI